MAKKFFFSFLIAVILALPFYSLLPQKKVEKVLPISYSSPPGSLVVARVGQYTLSEVSGWTSPFAEVTLTGKSLARKTIADQNGFFIFTNIPVIDNLGELCLIAEDINHIASFPTCLAPPQPKDELAIRNILLAPSISLEKGKIALGKTAKASGMTFPESEVDVYLFENPSPSFWSQIANSSLRIPIPKLSMVKNSKLKVKSGNCHCEGFIPEAISFRVGDCFVAPPLAGLLAMTFFELCTLNFALINPAYAAGLPIYKVKSNPNGYFEFSLPTANASENRLFATAVFDYLSFQQGAESDASWNLYRFPIKSGITEEEDPRESQFNSPKSNTLIFLVYKSYWLALLLLFLLFLLILIFIFKKEKKNKLLVLENQIAVYKPYCETKIPYGPKVLRF